MPEKRRCEVERYRDAVMQSSSEEAETFREGVDSQKNRIGCACVQRHTILPVRPLRTPMRLACASASGAHIDSPLNRCERPVSRPRPPWRAQKHFSRSYSSIKTITSRRLRSSHDKVATATACDGVVWHGLFSRCRDTGRAWMAWANETARQAIRETS